MSSAALAEERVETPDPFSLSLPSPLPSPAPASPPIEDAVTTGERLVTHADANDDLDARAHARLALADTWLSLGLLAPALALVHEADSFAPTSAAVLEHRVALLPRAARLREAAEATQTLARANPTTANLLAAVRAWLRAEDVAEAFRALNELHTRTPDDPQAAALRVSFARLRHGLGDAPPLLACLLECAAQARRRDDRERWRTYALDAWIESRGTDAGELLTEALASTGHPRAAVYVAAESAARALLANTPDIVTASRLLVRCARLAESAGLPGEASAAWAVRALIPDPLSRDARESLRDILAERGRSVELAVRLRADARRGALATRAATWKGVAAIEIAHSPAQAAFALAEALRHQPDDAEALDLLNALANDPSTEPAVRDALWSIVRSPALEGPVRARLLLWLGNLEEHAGDHASAEFAFSAIEGPVPEAFEGLARVYERAEALIEEAAAAFARLEQTTAEEVPAALDAFIATFGGAPGAFRDARQAMKTLGAHALHDDRVASLWVRAARRAEDESWRVTVLNRLATRCVIPSVRVRAALECAETLDQQGETNRAADLLAFVLTDLPAEPAVAAALAALAEHGTDATLATDALRAIARAATDSWERDFLARFTGRAEGTFAVFAASLGAPVPSREWATNLARLHDLMGDSATLLAHRTRALLPPSEPAEERLDVARRFAVFDPLSPEATIAWFSAASMAEDAIQIAQAAIAVTRSLASARYVNSTVRTAIEKLTAVGAHAMTRDVVMATSQAVGLGDPALRNTVQDVLAHQTAPLEAAQMLEALAVCAEAPEELVPVLRTLAARYRACGHVTAEISALGRLYAHAPEEAATRLGDLLARTGDTARRAKLLRERIESQGDAAARKTQLFALAAEHAHAHPPRVREALQCLDQVVADDPSAETQGAVVRALLALDKSDAAIERLIRWAGDAASEPDAVARYLCATRIAKERRDPSRALAILRTLLRRVPSSSAALELAEETAFESRQHEALFAIYDDLDASVAGEHGRHALSYRRARFLERCGRYNDALAIHQSLFARAPSLGASFSAIERLAGATGQYDACVQALRTLGEQATTPEARTRYFLRGAAIAWDHARDAEATVAMELLAYLNDHVAETEARLLEHTRELRARKPEAAARVIQQLIDDALNAGAQSWDDGVRFKHALRALELALTEQGGIEKALAAVTLLLRDREDVAVGRESVRALLARTKPDAAVRAAILALPAMESGEPSAAPPPAGSSVRPPVSTPPEPAATVARPPPLTLAPTIPTLPPVGMLTDTQVPKVTLVGAPPPPLSMQPVTVAKSIQTPAASASAQRSSRPAPNKVPPSKPRTISLPPPPPLRVGSSGSKAASGKPPASARVTTPPTASPPASQPAPPPTQRPATDVSALSPLPEAPLSPSEMPNPYATIEITASRPAIAPPPDASIEPVVVRPAIAPPPDTGQPHLVSRSDRAGRPPFNSSSHPPPASDAPRVRVTVSSLRDAAARGDDHAAARLARHLASDPETSGEALEIERRRFAADPSRRDALDAMIRLAEQMRMGSEESALRALRTAVWNDKSTPPAPPSLADLGDGPDGVARVLVPARLGPFSEFGAVLWELLAATFRRDLLRAGKRREIHTYATPAGEFGRLFLAALRVLQLPRNTPLALFDDLPEGVGMDATTQPPTVTLAAPLAHDTPRTRFLLGLTLEGTRASHLPLTSLPQDEGERVIQAVHAAFGTDTPPRLDARVAKIAGRMLDGMTPRLQKRLRDLVNELGPRLTWAHWNNTAQIARVNAALLISGDVRTAVEEVLGASPRGVPGDPAVAARTYEPLRELMRFASSEEYVLLRWQRGR